VSPVEFDDLPFRERPDLTPYLIHLTRGTEREDRYSALDNLISILKTGVIRGSSASKGFIIGPREATCFMDVPFIALKYVCKEWNRSRYEPYGVVVSKRFAYEQGARPVLYLSKKERADLEIPRSELWRVVRFEVSDSGWISWLHEREWRCPDSFQLSKALVAVLVKTTTDAMQLQAEIDADRRAFKSIPKSIIPLHIVCQGLKD
jgi:hypothetical protein